MSWKPQHESEDTARVNTFPLKPKTIKEGLSEATLTLVFFLNV